MKSSLHTLAIILLTLTLACGLILSATSPAWAKDRTYTGVVSDALCGAKHMMPGDDASCTRACVSKGSKYALVVGDNVYTLDTSDKAALAILDKQAGAKVIVTGTESNDTITVTSVKAAK